MNPIKAQRQGNAWMGCGVWCGLSLRCWFLSHSDLRWPLRIVTVVKGSWNIQHRVGAPQEFTRQLFRFIWGDGCWPVKLDKMVNECLVYINVETEHFPDLQLSSFGTDSDLRSWLTGVEPKSSLSVVVVNPRCLFAPHNQTFKLSVSVSVDITTTHWVLFVVEQLSELSRLFLEKFKGSEILQWLKPKIVSQSSILMFLISFIISTQSHVYYYCC